MVEKKKAKPRGKPFKKNDPSTGTVDERINRAGAPIRGASMKEQFDFADRMTAEEIVELLPPGPLRQAYQQMPKGIPMKLLKALRVNAAIMFDPTPGLLKEATDRTDGKVPDTVNIGGKLEIPALQETLKKVYGRNTTDQ